MKILKPIVFGVLLGAGLFYAPFFLLRIALVFLVIGALFRLFRARRGYGPRGHGWHGRSPEGLGAERRLAFADKIRGMNDEEYTHFKEKFQRSTDTNEAAAGNDTF